MAVSKHKRAVDTFTGLATATITFSGVPAINETIIILDKDSTTRTFTAKGSETAASLQFNQSGTAAAAATSLKACIDHANGHNESITVTDDGAGVLTLTWAAGGVAAAVANDSAYRTITSTLANVTVTNFLGGDTGAEDVDGGSIVHGGSISSARWTNKTVSDLNKGADSYGSLVYDSSWVDKVVSSQDLAYNPNGHAVSRTKANSGFLIRGVQTLIGGKAATADILNILNADGTSRPAGNIHGLETTRQHGTWATTTFDLFGTGALSGSRTGAGSSSSYINPLTAGGATASADSAVAVTRAIPGEFAILVGFVDWTSSSGSGDGSGAVNLMDYSAITG